VFRFLILGIIAKKMCEIWSLTLREKRRLRVFENRVLRRIFGPKRDEVTGEWRRLHKKQLYALYSSPDFIWVIKSRGLRWTGHVAWMGTRRSAYRILVGNPEGRRLLGRPRRIWEDNIKVDLRDVGWGAWTGTVWLKIDTGVVNAVMNFRVP
jgi:PAS domain-containing protein